MVGCYGVGWCDALGCDSSSMCVSAHSLFLPPISFLPYLKSLYVLGFKGMVCGGVLCCGVWGGV